MQAKATQKTKEQKKYTVKPAKDLRSKYEIKMEARRKKEEEEAEAKFKKEEEDRIAAIQFWLLFSIELFAYQKKIQSMVTFLVYRS